MGGKGTSSGAVQGGGFECARGMLTQSLLDQEEVVMKSIAKLSWVLVALVVLLAPSLTFAQHYIQTNLVSDGYISTPTVDPNLKDSWGLARSSTSAWWVADNDTGVSTLYSYINTGGTVTLK